VSLAIRPFVYEDTEIAVSIVVFVLSIKMFFLM
jgi:hypothetical protein